MADVVFCGCGPPSTALADSASRSRTISRPSFSRKTMRHAVVLLLLLLVVLTGADKSPRSPLDTNSAQVQAVAQVSCLRSCCCC